MPNLTTTERTSERELVITRSFAAPVQTVFDAWTKPELFQRWWTPPSFGITFASCELDARTGGRYHFVFTHPDFPEPMAFFGRYLEVVAPSRIVWTNEESAEGSISTLTLEERDGRTHLTLHELYPSAAALDEAMASGSVNGASAQFELLDEVLPTLVGG
ncbi:MAG: SRPBCC family protein [Gemmatimonadales bacterium]|nr:SRPBCC family protein [Gemmatimonadales bacterium]